MKCPRLEDLPPPPPGKSGWPWTTGALREADASPSHRHWPRISVVTPSLNQGEFLEETIRSVLLQDYPNLQYRIYDGGSTDRSVDIIRKYETWLHYWSSNPDGGQTHAINQGFDRANGELFAWLNSDDLYVAGALCAAARVFPRDFPAIVAGSVVNFDGKKEVVVPNQDITFESAIRFWEGRNWHQPGLLFPAEAYRRCGRLDESLHHAMDFDLLCRMLPSTPVVYTGTTLALFRIHPDSKTTKYALARGPLENARVCRRYWDRLGKENLPDCVWKCTRFLVRRGYRLALLGKIGSSASLMRAAWSISRTVTLRHLVIEPFQPKRPP